MKKKTPIFLSASTDKYVAMFALFQAKCQVHKQMKKNKQQKQRLFFIEIIYWTRVNNISFFCLPEEVVTQCDCI